ncbi:MAG: anti-sigma factor family protein [Gemmatimonadales bacterium]
MMDATPYGCEEVFRRLDDYLDRELSGEEIALVREHLDRCAVCASEHRFGLHVLDDIKLKLRRLTAPPELLARVRSAIAQAETREG